MKDLKNLNRDYTAKKSHQSNLPTQPRNLTSPIYLHSQEISPVQFTYTAKKSHQSNLPTQLRIFCILTKNILRNEYSCIIYVVLNVKIKF